MGDAQEQDQYEERLKEVFNSFDASGSGSLCPEELSDLCQSLHLDDATPALLQALLQNQDRLTGRVDFDQFKNALILVLSSNIEPPQAEQEPSPRPESPEVQPKFVKGSKRYGRRSTPEFIEPISDFSELGNTNAAEEEHPEEDNDDSAVPRKRERWNAHETTTEEYEAEGQMHLWNPDEPSTPRGSVAPLSERLEERLREACDELGMPWDGCAGHRELQELCEHLGLEVKGEMIQILSGDGGMNVQEFLSRVVNHSKPPTPSASTPYRQLKRHHSTQPFDEGGRRIATPSAMTSTIGLRLFSTLDDGTGYTPVEYILDAWMDEGIENSSEILQALDFSLDGKLNLSELTIALENELLVTKNGIHQAALASFKAEIRYLLERVDRELREKEKIRSDLEKAEKLKSQLATEVDEHHSAIEHMNDLNLRKLEQDHKEKVAAVRSELMKEMDQIQQQAGLQREELEAEIEKIREDETFLRDHLSISVKENRRLEMELLDSTEKFMEAQSQISKLQTILDNILKEKFGDLDPGSADFFLQEERIKQIRNTYEEQCRELQDRIDELQSELQEYHSFGRAHQPCSKPLSEELESKSPGMESDPGIGSDEVQPFSMSLEAEMMLEQLKDQHLREMDDLRIQLESKIKEFDKVVDSQRATHEEQKAALSLRYQEEIASIQSRTQELQSQLEQAKLEHARLEQRQAGEREELENQQEEEVGTLRQQLLEAHTHAADLEDQLRSLEAQQAESEVNLDAEIDELKKEHALEITKLEEKHKELLQARLEEERIKLEEERAEVEKKLIEDWGREREQLQQSHEDNLRARLEEASVTFEDERDELVKRLTEEWQKERAQLDEQSNESLQLVLEEEMLSLVKEQEEKEKKLREEWETERAQLQESQEEALLTRVAEERLQLHEQHELRVKRLKEEWEREKLQLEEDYEGMLQDRLNEEREKLEAEKEEVEKRLERLMKEEKARLEDNHREAMQELTAKHSKERETLSTMLDKLRDDINQERRELETHFSQKIKEVEHRFSGDQESVAEHFHADVLKLEQHYQSELKALSESHAEQKLKWEAEMKEAVEEAKEQRRMMQEAMEQERESLSQDWAKKQDELESRHKEESEALVKKNQELQKELDNFVSLAQTKEIELSRQLNDLHNRLQDSLQTKDELLAQSERKALEIELLLNQAVDDFKQEREELQSCLSEIEANHKEVLVMSERQIKERIELLSECDDLKMKIEELDMLLKQAAVDFELEKQELQENIETLEQKLKDNVSCFESQENEKVELKAERDLLCVRVKELERNLSQVLASANTAEMMLVDDEAIAIQDNYNMDAESVVHLEQFMEVEANWCEICPDNIDSKSSNQETVCLSPNVSVPVEASTSPVEQDDDVERISESPDSGEEWPKNTDCVDVEHDNEDPAVNDDENMPAVENDATESQKQDDETAAEDQMAKNNGTFSNEEGPCLPELIFTNAQGAEFPVPDEDQCGDAADDKHVENKMDDFPPERQCQGNKAVSSYEDAGEDAEYCENNVSLESCEEDTKPQDVLALEHESPSHEEERCHEIAVDASALEATGDPDELNLEDADGNCLSKVSHSHGLEVELVSPDCEHFAPDSLKPQISDCEDLDCSLQLHAKYKNATEENILLHEKISLLKQKTDTLENLLAHKSEKIELGHQILEENYNLKVKMLFFMEHAKDLEMKTLKMTDLQIRYDDCMSENTKLKDQNCELVKRVWDLENRMHIVHDFQHEQITLVDEIARMRMENAKLSELVSELEGQDEILLSMNADARSSFETPTEDTFQHLNSQLEAKIQAVTDLEECCVDFERQNMKLRRAITDLQDKSLTLTERMQIHRLEASRLAEENVILRNKIAALKEEDLEQAHEDLLQKLEHLSKEKITAQKMAENFKEQISELHLRSQQLEDENGLLMEKQAQNAADVQELSQQLVTLTKENERTETMSAEERTQMAACVSAMEAELTKALEGTAQLEERNAQLAQQLSDLREKVVMVDTMETQLTKAQERVKAVDETLQAVNLQSARLKSDLRVSHQDRDALKHEVMSLQKQLQNSNEKNHVLEMALHSGGLKSQNKKLYRDEMSRLLDQEQQLLRQENERLQTEVDNTKGDLVYSRERIRQLEATILAQKQNKQQGQSCQVKALEQENAALKQELEAKNELTRDCEAGKGHTELESLKQENEALKAQLARLSSQLIETFQAQLVGLLPPSPHRIPRGQHRADEPDNMQDERERKMRSMEERLKEIELSLHNVKLLLKEKVSQLRDQLHKNDKADVLIKDLYVENTQLLKALEITEQRQKIAEKKNYLLEEKISSLNKIVRDLNPSALPPVPYHFQCS
ncbi:ninein isoform X2 [Myripristis murdjan]|uniref:ninein isoform X2 n=1 Tax=Myripristis murdjan TaxID=586833 RepID=UPI001175EEA1|nr:ninein isoform X2 [Myripristis murdjan]